MCASSCELIINQVLVEKDTSIGDFSKAVVNHNKRTYWYVRK